MNAITYRLRLLEPVLVSQAESGEENSAIGLSFVPGSVLRGVLAERYLREHRPTDPAADETFRHLFLDGSVCFLNAYPWREKERTLPKPASWMTEKELADADDGPVYDWAVEPEMTEHPELDHPKPPKGDFCLVQDDSVAMIMPARQVNVHISLEQVNDRTDENKVYRYDALAAGEVLAGAIMAEDVELLGKLHSLLAEGEISLGGAHLAGYGRVRVEGVTDRRPDWSEYQPVNSPAEAKVVVTLLSDAIVRGANGQVNGDVSATLAAALKLPALKPVQSFCHLRLVGGYNRKWSLPLPQTWAVQAGSVFVYQAGAFQPEDLRQAVALGIGERCAEGFGRIAVNWQAQAELRRRKPEPLPLDEPQLTDGSKALAQAMAERRLRLLLDRKLAEAINDISVSKPRPQNAQLSRVRGAAQQALKEKVLEPVRAHLRDLKKDAKTQFERARIKGTPLLSWIQERAERLDVQEQLLREPISVQVAGQPAQLTESLRAEYTARLLDGVMKKAIKQNQQEEGA
jgi:CRISPR-associated protein Csx10